MFIEEGRCKYFKCGGCVILDCFEKVVGICVFVGMLFYVNWV